MTEDRRARAFSRGASAIGAGEAAALLGGTLIGTMALGVFLRWWLAGAYAVDHPFAHLRHAHSHLGYFGVLFPLAWIGWAVAGEAMPSRRAWWSYAFVTLFTTAGFAHRGYAPLAIVGSTVVSLYWLWSARGLWRRLLNAYDVLAVVPLGIVASLVCVPPIALSLRQNPAFAQSMVSTFLCALLLLVVVPSVVASLRPRLPWPLFFLSGALTALLLGPWPHWTARIGAFAYAALLMHVSLRCRLATHLRAVWATVALGLVALASGLVPNVRPVALAAIHFVILSP
ncbi:MAG: hypothetical protein AAF411_17865, partial [Myxococcota bacterium]